MSATSRDLPGADMAETVVYEPSNQPGHDRPVGSPEMTKPNLQGNHRYTFGSGARPLDGYTIKRAIGRGGFGEVYYATSDSGKEVALKLILHNLEVERRGVVQCMNLKCPNLLTIHDLKSNDAGDSFVIMEYVAGPSLANVLAQYPNGMPPAEVRAWLKGLVDGVAYLHDHGIVHRDLKPANMFMEEGFVKIGDYGLAKLINASQDTGHSESIGTCHYMAPEIASGKYQKPIDVYAIGVILYEMLTGRVPFEGESVGEILMKHLTARPDLKPLAEPYRSIVGRALAKDPAQRPARLYDLLPSEDAPKAPPVRFIGDGKVSPASLPPDLLIVDEEIHRIGPEEPVFYIGPDTRPPRRQRPPLERLRENWGAMRRPARPAPPPAPPRAARPVAEARRRAPAPAPAPLAPPPPLPGTRIRVAELATSMIWAAVLALVMTLAVGLSIGIDVPREPEQGVYLFALTLLGTWGALIAGKGIEGRTIDLGTRRMGNALFGGLLGVAALVLTAWLGLNPGRGLPDPVSTELVAWLGPIQGSNTARLRFPVYFGLLGLITGGWNSLTLRDRKARFRLFPIILTGLAAAVLFPIWPHSADPSNIAAAVSIAVVTQLVSPWNQAAAAYARATRKRRFA
ncbi:Serine/threonine protein kinase [Singulisphaera sp. GP187]|uniref:serine/threonine-protein kinase n=1 Tax=Singulisphaera sp. GP187 TaxID=1882752 RepID=UPI000928AE30|nr:serine/threonine-protein kinase [Singulisphaera sp. GP187]SIO56192.1 Serine/threonine protein kinase [Singulisphaera sp. GP187]